MRRVVLAVIALFLFSINICKADEYRLDSDTKYQKSVMETGFKLLNCSNLQKRMTFYFVSDKNLKTKINVRAKRVDVYKGVFAVIEDENELAALLSVNIAQLLDQHAGLFRRVSVSFSPRKYEVKADKKAVDLMVNAGYDPVALITIIDKIDKEQNWFEYNIFRHNGSERIKYIYHYIYEKYPIYLADNKYLTTPYYQNFLRVTNKDRKKVRIIQEEKIKKEKKEKINKF